MFTQVAQNKRALWYPSPKTNAFRKVVLFIPGFPKYPGRSEFINFFAEIGFDVLVPMYSGTFESGGKFSIERSVDDVKIWYNFLKKKVFFKSPTKKKKINIKEIILFSSSFGCLVAGLALKKFSFSKIKKCVFVSPLWDMSSHGKNKLIKERAKKTLELMNFSFPFSYRFANKSNFFSKIIGTYNIKGINKSFVDDTKHFYVFCGKNDTVTPITMSKALAKEYVNSTLYILDGGHSSKIDLKKFKKITKQICLNQLG